MKIRIFFIWFEVTEQKTLTVDAYHVPRVDESVDLPEHSGTVREVHWTVHKTVECAAVHLR